MHGCCAYVEGCMLRNGDEDKRAGTREGRREEGGIQCPSGVEKIEDERAAREAGMSRRLERRIGKDSPHQRSYG